MDIRSLTGWAGSSMYTGGLRVVVVALCVVVGVAGCEREGGGEAGSASGQGEPRGDAAATPSTSDATATRPQDTRQKDAGSSPGVQTGRPSTANTGNDVLDGSYRVTGEVTVQLADPANRFPDKNPKAVVGAEAQARGRALAKALQDSRWTFSPQGVVHMQWHDPVLNRSVELKGTWEAMFGRLMVKLSNSVVTTQLPDGSPNAATSFSGQIQTGDDDHLGFTGNLFHAPPDDAQRSTGSVRLKLAPSR